MSELYNEVYNDFYHYSGSVIMNRAICDVRDMLKPSARMLMYSQEHITKNRPNKPFVKSARVVGDALGHYYYHGDISCYGTYMRMAKPFAMRYPLEDCQGNSGTITATRDEAASRYTELRLSKLAGNLFTDIEKKTVSEWDNSFDDTDIYPRVLPSKGFYNIVNGSTGIGVGLASSIPQFNIKEVNEALIKLLENPNIDFNEIYCEPDFATGAIILNGNEVKESLRAGKGAAIKMRAIIEYEEKDNVLRAKELPYGVYTNTISEQIQKLLEEHPNCGIEKINDGSGKTPDYLIYLSKKASVSKVLKLLYKYTSLQSFYSINMNMLDEGRYPKTFGWKEALQAYLNHEKVVYRKGFEYDLQKILDRLHIIDGLLKAIANIDKVVHTIKSSSNTIVANKALQKLLNIDEIQAKAILDIKLARLAHMEINKLENEKVELETEKSKIEAILADENLLNKEIEKGLKEVSDKFGDARRTRILNIENEEDEVKEVEDLMVSITSSNNFYVNTTSSLYTSGRRTKGEKIKGTAKNEYVIDTSVGNNKNDFLLFSDKGKVYKFNFAKCETKTMISFFDMIHLEEDENIVRIKNVDKSADFVIFTTHNGYIKKSSINEYSNITKRGIIAIKLEPNDYIVGIDFVKDEPIAIVTNDGYFALRDTLSIRPTGRTTRGIKAINLKNDDKIAAAHKTFKNGKEIMILTSGGKCNRISVNEYNVSSNAIRGKKVITLDCNDKVIDFVMIHPNQNEVIITYKKTQNKFKIEDIALTNRGSKGVKVANDKPLHIF